MILTFNISEPNLFRIHFDVQKPLVIINHLLNILPEIPLNKIKLTLSESTDQNINETHIFAHNFLINIKNSRLACPDVNFLM